MSLSVVDIYQTLLPKTNCGDCGYPTCLTFASMVVSEKLALHHCPHIDPSMLAKCQAELNEQHAEGKWVKRDMAQDALEWAQKRAASLSLKDLPGRIGGVLKLTEGEARLELPYFKDHITITSSGIAAPDGSELNRWEQVFIYNHMAQGGLHEPTGKWKSLEEIPNTISKRKSMREHVEKPLETKFRGRADHLKAAAAALGGKDISDYYPAADLAIRFIPLPRIPVLLLFWDEAPQENFPARVKLLFDETIPEHLDIESIIFLSERLAQLLEEQTS
jgi:hypothetical protein